MHDVTVAEKIMLAHMEFFFITYWKWKLKTPKLFFNFIFSNTLKAILKFDKS